MVDHAERNDRIRKALAEPVTDPTVFERAVAGAPCWRFGMISGLPCGTFLDDTDGVHSSCALRTLATHPEVRTALYAVAREADRKHRPGQLLTVETVNAILAAVGPVKGTDA
jgi:hypothetical protein